MGDKNAICGCFGGPVFNCALTKFEAMHGATYTLNEILNFSDHLEILTEQAKLRTTNVLSTGVLGEMA